MDDTNKSTEKEPLRYFQWMFLEIGFISYKYSYRNKADFNTELKKHLTIEFSTFVNNLDKSLDSIAYQDKSPDLFLSRLHQKAKRILNRAKSKTKILTIVFEPVIKEYPFIEDILLNILHHIEKEQQSLQSVSNTSNTNVKEVKQAIDDIDAITNKSIIEFTPTQQLVLGIFGYFKDRMNPKSEYDRLIECVVSFVDTGIIPDNSFRKFSHIYSVKNEEIRYTFYVLYGKNKKKIDREQLCSFIISIFEDFSDVSQKYVYSKLSTPPDEFSPYIPDFIRKFKD